MTINATDIKLLESERMTDTSDGGGRRTNNVIEDGDPGNIFPKVSRLDSVYGRVNMRKVFSHVATENLDVYAGAHAVITDAPDNDRIHISMFSTASDTDNRTAARDRIESYVIAGPESRMILYGRQLAGAKAVLAYQRNEEPLPEIGEVYCLSREDGDDVIYQQYIRIENLTHEVRKFDDGGGEFERRVLSLQLSTPLLYEFRGPDAPVRSTNVARSSRVRTTTVADASRYAGIRKLSQAAEQDDLTVKVESVFTPIVPSTQRESPLTNTKPSGAGAFVFSGNNYSVQPSSFAGTYYFPTSIVPGTFKWRVSGVIVGEDNGSGVIEFSEPIGGILRTGTIDYETGRVDVNISWVSDGTQTLEAKSGAQVEQPSHNIDIPVTIATRGTVYTLTVNPLPAPGSMYVDYRALGRWYRLRDNGAGALTADDPAYGVGTVDYVTGAVLITLGALPDVDSSVLISWGSAIHYIERFGAESDAGDGAVMRGTLQNLPVERGSIAGEWFIASSGTPRTFTDNSLGVLSGTGLTGTINYTTGEFTLSFTGTLPDADTEVTIGYEQVEEDGGTDPVAQTYQALFTSLTIDLGGSVAPDSLELRLPYQVNRSFPFYADTHVFTFKDNGVGGVVLVSCSAPTTRVNLTNTGAICGTINYATGVVTMTDEPAANVIGWQVPGLSIGGGSTWMQAPASISQATTFYVNASFNSDPAVVLGTPREDVYNFVDNPLIMDLTRTVSEPLVPGSILFTLAGRQYTDRNGVLYYGISTSTGSGTAAGSVDYSTGECSLTSWAENASASISVQACLSTYGEFSTVDGRFRTNGSPLRPASFSIQATALDGTLVTGTADQNGDITGTYVEGSVEQTMGVVSVRFGEYVTAAGNEDEPWYNEDNVVGPNVWKPLEVVPSTIRYSTVVISNLPLNASVLGLDPVRLPSNGEVPIYRPADVVLIHNTKRLTLTNPVSAGATYSVGRANLAELYLVDADGVDVPTNKYTVNLTAGSVTMAADLSLTGIPQPLVAVHRIEQMNLLSDVQINGELSLTAPLSRDFDADDTYVSSALLFGDMYARVTNVFDQQTWTNEWADSRIGSEATGQFNDVDYPIEVVNEAAVTERWRIHFTSTSAFQVIGENLGVIAIGTTGSDLAPVNPLTSLPYFTLRSAGWGVGGWSTGNQLRFNTVGASAPIWIARTILPGATLEGDSFDLQVRGDVDA